MAISITPTSSSSSSSSFGIFGTQSYRSQLGLDIAFPSSKRRACTPGGSIPSSYCTSCIIIRMGPAPPGQIQRLVLSKEGRMKLNRYPDRDFYSFPRFVKHVDDTFLATLTEVYRERIREGAEVLDLMSSWVSHLPEDVKYKRVVGQGLNAGELARNPRLDKFFVRDLNSDEKDGLRWLQEEMEASSFDAVVCTVSVQYLEEPEKVFAGIWRVLRPGGVCIVSFSNRMFYEKAVAAWRDGTAYSRTQLVQQYFQCISGFTQPEVIRRPSPLTLKDTKSPFQWLAQLFQAPISDPFYAVIAHKNFKPILEDSSNMPPTN